MNMKDTLSQLHRDDSCRALKELEMRQMGVRRLGVPTVEVELSLQPCFKTPGPQPHPAWDQLKTGPEGPVLGLASVPCIKPDLPMGSQVQMEKTQNPALRQTRITAAHPPPNRKWRESKEGVREGLKADFQAISVSTL